MQGAVGADAHSRIKPTEALCFFNGSSEFLIGVQHSPAGSSIAAVLYPGPFPLPRTPRTGLLGTAAKLNDVATATPLCEVLRLCRKLRKRDRALAGVRGWMKM